MDEHDVLLVLILMCSSTHERKSKTAIFVKNNKIYLKHNSIAEDIPVVIFMKVFGLAIIIIGRKSSCVS